MDPASARDSKADTPAFEDGLGIRHRTVDATGTGELEVLRLSSELTAVPPFEFALRERVNYLSSFRHPSYGHVRSVERPEDAGSTLSVVSEHTPGVRLSEILAQTERGHLTLDINAALALIRQLVPAVALLHEQIPDIANGAIAPEHIVITPNARLVIVEYVLGAALEQLRYSQARYWTDLRLALPRSAGHPLFDQRTDVTQVGAVALALVLGRSLAKDEYPARIAEALSSAWAISAGGGLEPLPAGVRSWLSRALQLDPRSSFASCIEARAELDNVLDDSDYVAGPSALEAFLALYHASSELALAPAQPRADSARSAAAAPRPVAAAAPVVARPITAGRPVAPPAAAAAPPSAPAPPKAAAPTVAAPAKPAAASPAPASRVTAAPKAVATPPIVATPPLAAPKVVATAPIVPTPPVAAVPVATKSAVPATPPVVATPPAVAEHRVAAPKVVAAAPAAQRPASTPGAPAAPAAAAPTGGAHKIVVPPAPTAPRPVAPSSSVMGAPRVVPAPAPSRPVAAAPPVMQTPVAPAPPVRQTPVAAAPAVVNPSLPGTHRAPEPPRTAAPAPTMHAPAPVSARPTTSAPTPTASRPSSPASAGPAVPRSTIAASAAASPAGAVSVVKPKSEPAVVKPKESELRPFADRFESPAPPRFGVGEELYFSMPEEEFPAKRPKSNRRIAVAVVLVGLVAGGVLGVRRYLAPAATAARTGTLVVTTEPAGVPVTIDGQQKGVTPITLTLTAGPHVLGLLASEEPRTVPVIVTAGTELSQYFELRRSDVARGQLQVRTDPPGAKVTLDGRLLGTSPVSADDLTPGSHTIVLENEFRVVTETVTVEAGATASLVVPLGQLQSATAPGWVSLVAPVDMQLFENGRLLGTSRGERVVLSTGRHDIEIVNEPLQYRATRTIQVLPGKMSPIKLDWPKGTIALNAIPWADVWIDGEKIGETPIGSVSLPIGPHEIIFRNPELGERKYTTTITAGSPARLSADFTSK